MFYFDNNLKQYEKSYQWGMALNYLEDLYSKTKRVDVLCSLIGFSWYYFVEGGCISGNRNEDDNGELECWKKYINIGINEFSNIDTINFISGYTLSLHGFFISTKYENLGIDLIKNCFNLTHNSCLKALSDNFLNNYYKKRIHKLAHPLLVLNQLFFGESLLDQYFKEIYK